MEEIRRRDSQVFLKCVFSGAFWPLFGGWLMFFAILSASSGLSVPTAIGSFAVLAVVQCVSAYRASHRLRFHDPRLHSSGRTARTASAA